MVTVLVFLTSLINLAVAGINLAIAIRYNKRNKKDSRSTKRKS